MRIVTSSGACGCTPDVDPDRITRPQVEQAEQHQVEQNRPRRIAAETSSPVDARGGRSATTKPTRSRKS